jgi:arsenate reductase-like glutaredoxin family protein
MAPYNFPRGTAITPYPFKRRIVPEEVTPQVIELILSEGVKDWLAQKVRETGEPTENVLQTLGTAVRNLQEASIATHEWSVQMEGWQREIGGKVNAHEEWTTQLERMDEDVQHLLAAMSDMYPSHVWTQGQCTNLYGEIRKLNDTQLVHQQRIGDAETQLAQAREEFTTLQAELGTLSAAATQGTQRASTEFNSVFGTIALFSTRLENAEERISRYATELQGLKARVDSMTTTADTAISAQLAQVNEKINTATGRLDVIERVNLQLATQPSPQDPARPSPSMHPDMLRQFCEVEIWKKVSEFEASMNARMTQQIAQQVEQKVRDMLATEGVSKREYGKDRVFTETALESLRARIEDLQLNWEAREGEADEDGEQGHEQPEARQRDGECHNVGSAATPLYAASAPPPPCPGAF